jgi:biopolymer transport protein TolR
MAFGRLERNTPPPPMGEINMTPLIDVMLVLLVIFMITAPLMTGSLKLDLPKAGAPASGEPPAFVTVALNAQGELYLGEEKLAPAALQTRLADTARKAPDTEVQLRADQSVPYGRVAELIGQLQKLGLSRIAFVTAPAGAASGS